MKIQILSLLGAAALFVGCASNSSDMGGSPDNDNNVLTGGPVSGTTLHDLPSPVKQTLRKYEPHAEIVDIDKVRRDNSVVYKVNFTEPRLNPPMWIMADGGIWWESSVDR